MSIANSTATLPLDDGLFGQLRREAGALWTGYVRHRFVEALGDGTLAPAAFRRYLTQDYLFLVQFARAYALAGYKGTRLSDLRAAAAAMTAILETEMPLHVSYCAGWGISEADMLNEPEALETIAYTRFVLERGMAGDLLDLHVALAPCVVGYAEIGDLLSRRPQRPDNPYAAWIAAYAAPEYCRLAGEAIRTLDRLGEERGAIARWGTLAATFRAATMLETAFWAMGLAAAG
ncbi:MAG: TenA family protein [Acetobacteraceae bacterium]